MVTRKTRSAAEKLLNDTEVSVQEANLPLNEQQAALYTEYAQQKTAIRSWQKNMCLNSIVFRH